MDEVIWVEVLSRGRDVVAQRYRCTGPEIRIGRSYGNQVVLDDPLVAPEHLRVLRDEAGQLVAEDLGTANGLFDGRGRERHARVPLDGHRAVRIGNTFLRIREPGHPVGPERMDATSPRPWAWLALAASAVLAIELLSLWLSEIGTPHLPRYLIAPLTLALEILAWSGGWALATRILAGQARYDRHLLLAMGGVLAWDLFSAASRYASFLTASGAVVAYNGIALWVILATVAALHLRIIGPSHPRLKAGIVGGIAMVAIAIDLLGRLQVAESGFRQNTASALLPPALRVIPPSSEAVLFGDVGRLKEALDRDRATEPPSPAIEGFTGAE